MENAPLSRLRDLDISPFTGELSEEWKQADVRFVSSSAEQERRYYDAVRELGQCIKPAADEEPILHEGGVYHGCWLESTGTINTEILSRFLPDRAEQTFLSFARHQRADGLFPYKLTPDGPVFSQIQLVSPLARSVWNHASLWKDREDFLKAMYEAMGRYDRWLEENRNTRKTGGVEAFCTFDTGHDLSARFWHIPDSPHGNNPSCYDRNNPLLPLVAPDLTANVACQRHYLGKMAEALSGSAHFWYEKAEESRRALYDCCYHREDGFFYDLDPLGRHVTVQSDVLLRVLACEMGSDGLFIRSLERYLLNTGKFFAKYPLTSLALDDPRYDPSPDYNSWCGTSNFLTLIRTPHAFEYHKRDTELTWIMQPVMNALFRSERFGQNLHPYTGSMGFTEMYSPSILCMLDFTERLCGILPRPEGTLWFSCLTPYQMEHRFEEHRTAYGRTVGGNRFEMENEPEESRIYKNGDLLYRVPRGVRVVTDREGQIEKLIGLTCGETGGSIETPSGSFPFRLEANERSRFTGRGFETEENPGLTRPTY